MQMAVSRRSAVRGVVALGGLAVAAGAGALAPASRTLRLAVVQMASVNGDTAGNLRRAEGFARRAVNGGAKLVLFPEMMPGGYSLYYDVWDSAEPSNGQTARWLSRTSQRLGAWIGTSFLEADGEDFYNTFILTGPDGAEAGRVRKQVPADAEAYFFRGDPGPHVIETAIGRIGVSICAEGYYCFIAEQMRRLKADIVLMPHSAPDCSATGGLPAAPGTHLGLWYARNLGVPVAFVNKVGPFRTRALSPPPQESTGVFPGLSAIVDSDARVLKTMDGAEGISVADVVLDPARKTRAASVCTGAGIAELAIGGASGVAAVAKVQEEGAKAYAANALRRQKALAISQGQRNPAAGR
jgi:N-carbamoylputrescine amidase